VNLPAVKLREALSIISLVPSRSGIRPSEYIRCTASKGYLTMALSAEMFGEVAVAANGSSNGEAWVAYADRRAMSAFINACDCATDADDIITEFTSTDPKTSAGELKIRYKRRRANIQGLDVVSGYAKANLKELTTVSLTDDHKALIRLAAKYAPLDPTAANLNCVYLSKGKGIQSSNQVVMFSAADSSIPMTMPFPRMLPEILSNQAVDGIQVGEKGTRITFQPSGYLFQLINDECRVGFPTDQISDMVKECAKLPVTLTFKPNDLLIILQRLQTYTSGGGSTDVSVRCKGSAGKKVVVLTSEALQGAFHEALTIDKGLTEDVAVEWPLATLLPLTEFLASEPSMSVAFTDASPYSFRGTKGKNKLDLIIARK
jgi:hypothetical protein